MFRNLNTGVIGVKATLEETCKYARRHGFAGVDVAAAVVERLGAGRVREILDEHGLRVGGYGLPWKWLGPEDEWLQGLHEAPRLLGLGQSIGAERTTLVVPPSSDDRTYLQNFEFHVRRLKPVAHVLEDYGFRIGLEFIGPQHLRRRRKYSFLFDVDSCLELCSAVNERACGLLFDVWHWYTSEGTFEQVKKLSDRRIVYIHVNDAPTGVDVADQVDNVRCLPMETGVIDAPALLRILAQNGCRAPVTVEPFSAHVQSLPPDEAVKVTAGSLQKLWAAAGLE